MRFGVQLARSSATRSRLIRARTSAISRSCRVGRAASPSILRGRRTSNVLTAARHISCTARTMTGRPTSLAARPASRRRGMALARAAHRRLRRLAGRAQRGARADAHASTRWHQLPASHRRARAGTGARTSPTPSTEHGGDWELAQLDHLSRVGAPGQAGCPAARQGRASHPLAQRDRQPVRKLDGGAGGRPGRIAGDVLTSGFHPAAGQAAGRDAARR